jgi:hypothetical protein
MRAKACWSRPVLAIGKSKAAAVIFRIAFILMFFSTSAAWAQSHGPVVIELFTSAGCPACPEADENLNALAARPDILALACHVTYFDRATRKNNLSRPFCDARQGLYKLSLKTGRVFTPMMVFNGQNYITGKKNDEVSARVQSALNSKPTAAIDLTVQAGYLDIRLPQIAMENKAELWLIEYAPKAEGGYQNVITNFTKLMNWNGAATSMAFPIQESGHYAVIAQSYKTGIVAAGKIQ